jgi:hypothetical protein
VIGVRDGFSAQLLRRWSVAGLKWRMPGRISRRDFGKQTALGLAALAVPASAMQTAPATPPVPSADIDLIEKQLAVPISDAARKLMPAAVANNRKNGSDRLKTRLDDCSEPGFACLTFPGERTAL